MSTVEVAGQYSLRLTRDHGHQQWGFRLHGGADYKIPLSVHSISKGSLADKAGMRVNDILLGLNDTDLSKLTHKEAKEVILGAGSSLNFVIGRASVNVYSRNEPQREGTHSPNVANMHPNPAIPQLSPSHPTQGYRHAQYNSPSGLYSNASANDAYAAQTGGQTLGLPVDERGARPVSPTAQLVLNERLPAEHSVVLDEHAQQEEMRYHGYKNPDAQSRSFKILRDALSEEDPSVLAEKAQRAKRQATQQSGIPRCFLCTGQLTGYTGRVGDRLVHPGCMRCGTCGTSVRQAPYQQINNKLYCELHASQQLQLISGGFHGHAGIVYGPSY